MNLAERVSLKNKLIAESGLDSKEWNARATLEARTAGLEFNEWLAQGKNVSTESTLSGTAIFTAGVETAQEEVAASSEESGVSTVTEDNKLSTQGVLESENKEDNPSSDNLSGDDNPEAQDAGTESNSSSESAESKSTSPTVSGEEIVDQASSLRQIVSEGGAAEAVATSAEASISTESSSPETKEEQGAVEVSQSAGAKEQPSPVSQPQVIDESSKGAEEVRTAISTDRTLEVIGKDKGGPAIIEAADTTVGSGDVATQELFSKVAAATSQVGEELEASGDTYAEFIENHVSKLCQQARVSNIDLTSFGIRAQSLNYKNLKILSYGNHKFLGLPLNSKQEEALVFRLGLYCQQSPKDKIVIQAVSEVKDGTGFVFYSLLYTNEVVQKFVNATNFKVHINAKDPDVSKLVMVVEKCQNKDSILN